MNDASCAASGVILAAVLTLGLLIGSPGPARAALPGLVAGRQGASPSVTEVHLVVLVRPPLAVVTVFTELESPPAPMVLLLPVAPEVSAGELRTVKRDLLARLDRLTAPRLLAFYEHDPCDPSPPVQAWEHRVLPRDNGFLNANDPAGKDDRVPREIAVSLAPVFKEPVSEYTFSVLDPARDEVAAWLAARGYALAPDRLSALLERAAGGKLLVAEIDPTRVEIAASGGRERLPLAGIRYVTSSQGLALPVLLGSMQSSGAQDLFVFVLDRESQYAVKGYETLPAPTNLRVSSEARERVGELYDALHDRMLERRGAMFVTEFAWPSDGCGEPCPDAPLEPAELASLGADIVEARLVSAAERDPEPSPAGSTAPEARQGTRTPAERARDERDARRLRRELLRHEAWRGRHRYVVTRLHHRSDRGGLPREVEITPAPAIAGGTGVPRGKEGLATSTAPASGAPRFQVRYHLLERFLGPVSCPAPVRWRWGRRWDSLAREWSQMPLGRNLPSLRRDAVAPDRVVQSPLPELGIPSASPSAAPSSFGVEGRGSPSGGRCGCRSAGGDPQPRLAVLALLGALLACGLRRGGGPAAGRVPQVGDRSTC